MKRPGKKKKKKFQNSERIKAEGMPKKENNHPGAAVTWLFLSTVWSQMVTLYVGKHQSWQTASAWTYLSLLPRDLTRDGRDLSCGPGGTVGIYRKYRSVDLLARSKARELTHLSSSRLGHLSRSRRLSPNLAPATIFLIYSRADLYRIEWKFSFAHSRSISFSIQRGF